MSNPELEMQLAKLKGTIEALFDIIGNAATEDNKREAKSRRRKKRKKKLKEKNRFFHENFPKTGSKSRHQVILCTFPPINIKVDDDIDELDAVEVHNDESQLRQKSIRKIVPNTSSYNNNILKCSFNYETGFGGFVD
uniref:Uncharacterized protein n=1 Tax=Romanomermis culicivorax TaxID=13658 RepID=A0A915IC89_ROMCU